MLPRLFTMAPFLYDSAVCQAGCGSFGPAAAQGCRCRRCCSCCCGCCTCAKGGHPRADDACVGGDGTGVQHGTLRFNLFLSTPWHCNALCWSLSRDASGALATEQSPLRVSLPCSALPLLQWLEERGILAPADLRRAYFEAAVELGLPMVVPTAAAAAAPTAAAAAAAAPKPSPPPQGANLPAAAELSSTGEVLQTVWANQPANQGGSQRCNASVNLEGCSSMPHGSTGAQLVAPLKPEEQKQAAALQQAAGPAPSAAQPAVARALQQLAAAGDGQTPCRDKMFVLLGSPSRQPAAEAALQSIAAAAAGMASAQQNPQKAGGAAAAGAYGLRRGPAGQCGAVEPAQTETGAQHDSDAPSPTKRRRMVEG